MFCPVCEAEYEPGITHCADDGAELVESLTPESGASDDSEARFVPLHTLSSPAEAEMVNDILQQNGIRSVVQRSEEHTSELQSQSNLVCRLLLEKKKKTRRSCDKLSQ